MSTLREFFPQDSSVGGARSEGNHSFVSTEVDSFKDNRYRILFFSRGRGFGHAIPDMRIADELYKLEPNIDIRFASYSSGAVAFREHQRAVIDLKLKDRNSPWVVAVRAARLIDFLKPDLVISHEEFAAIPAAKIFRVPTVFITEWFSKPNDISMQSLLYADDVIFIEEPGIFEEPAHVNGRVFYAGPVLRKFNYQKADRIRARSELGISSDATVILVAPGGWATEQKEPILELVLDAFDSITCSKKILIWVTGDSEDEISKRCSHRSDVLLRKRDWQIDRMMVASDLAVTKANRITVKELNALTIPSISISHGFNPIDDLLIERIKGNIALRADTLTAELLSEQIRLSIEAQSSSLTKRSLNIESGNDSGAERAASRLAGDIRKWLPELGVSKS